MNFILLMYAFLEKRKNLIHYHTIKNFSHKIRKVINIEKLQILYFFQII
jgi:hypothetical protein